MDNWEINKIKWRRRFDNSTIYTYPEPIYIEMSDDDKRTRIEQFVREVRSYHYNYTYSFKEFQNFMTAQDISAIENLVVAEYSCPDGTKIPAGMKLLRAFKYFFQEKEELNKVQDLMNVLISQAKFTGYLHISVDPLDYLSVSENNYGWRSCHALDGDYAAGNLEYMMDKHTLVCYIDDNTQVQLHNFPEGIKWNNKKWRMLLFSSEDGCTVFAGRQYPFNIDTIWDKLRTCFMKFFPLNIYISKWSNYYLPQPLTITQEDIQLIVRHHHLYDEDNASIYPLEMLYHDTSSTTHTFFDDILYSSCYTEPYYLLGRSIHGPHGAYQRAQISTGLGFVTCPICGKHDLYRGEGWDCESCESLKPYTCECCGRSHFTENEGAWLISEEWWCNDCIADSAVTCAKCGELCRVEDAILNEETGEYVCPNCYEEEE